MAPAELCNLLNINIKKINQDAESKLYQQKKKSSEKFHSLHFLHIYHHYIGLEL